MDKFTREQIIEFYQSMGLSGPDFLSGGKIVNLYKLLEIVPEKNSNGDRLKTPYEILGVPPKFENGKEKPIVFAIKHKTIRIGKYEGRIVDFVYKRPKIVEEKTVLRQLKERYRAAIFAGNEEEAESCLSTISKLAGVSVREFKDSFYNYTKFYKRMRRQLLIDLFAHFFLTFVQNRSAIIKKGIILKNKLYKPYREKNKISNQDVTFDADLDIVNIPMADAMSFGMQNVKKVVISNSEFGDFVKVDVRKKNIEIKASESYLNMQGLNDAQKTDVDDIFKKSKDEISNIVEKKKENKEKSGFAKFGSFIKKKKRFLHKMNQMIEQNEEDFEKEEKQKIKNDKKKNNKREFEKEI